LLQERSATSCARSGVRVRQGVDKSSYLDRAYDEYCRRTGAGEALDLEAFCDEYPTFKSSLRKLIQAHRFLEENPQLLGEGQPISWPEPGHTFVGFTLLAELGRGAFARVFLAQQPALGNRLVAVKVSRQGASEAETLGRLSHPNIVPVYSVQEEPISALTVICMPYLGSATLENVIDYAFSQSALPTRAQVILEAVQDASQRSKPLAERALPERQHFSGKYIDGVIHLAVQLAEALAFVHKEGICHGDLKPSNVLMSATGRPMLMDFNLSSDERIADRRLGGTLPYMAPEQLRATNQERGAAPSLVNVRSDIFSLGLIVGELLTGVHPFGPFPRKASSQQFRAQMLERQRSGPRSLRQTNPLVDKRLAQLIERCLAFDPSARPQSADELAAGLRRSQSWFSRTSGWTARHVRVALLAISLLLVVSVASAYSLYRREPFSLRQYQKAREAYQNQRYQDVESNLRDVLQGARKLDPDLANEMLFLRGRAYLKRGQLDEAWSDFKSANQLHYDGRVQACLGYCWSLKGRHAWARDFYLNAVKVGEEAGLRRDALLNNLGRAHEAEGQLKEAKQCLDAALACNDRLQVAYHNRARVLLKEALLLTQQQRRPADSASHIQAIIGRGISDIEIAKQHGPLTAQLFYDAARLWTFAIQQEKGDSPRRQAKGRQALDNARQAIQHGFDPGRLRKDLFLMVLQQDFKSGFHEVMQSAPSSTPLYAFSEALLLLDPVSGLSD
jgi:serine/threonine protein kinase